MITIEKGIPLPVGWGPRSGAGKYPFAQMEVGDSFFVEMKPKTVSSAAYCWAHDSHPPSGRKFSVRKEADGCRCWRIQ